jgi:hypothetical protein
LCRGSSHFIINQFHASQASQASDARLAIHRSAQ